MIRSRRFFWVTMVGTAIVMAAGAFIFFFKVEGEQTALAPRSSPENPSDTTYLPLQQPAPAARRPALASIDEAIEAMEWGNIVFNVPERIRLGQAQTIQLLLSPTQTAQQLRQQIRLDTSDNLRDTTIRVSTVMHADLQGGAFNILSITPEVQAISRKEPTEWRWEVWGTAPGPQQSLHLTLYAIFEINGREMPRSIQTFEEVIEIDVTLSQQISQFVGNNWQWLWTALVIPLVGWMRERWKHRHQPSSPQTS